MVHKTYNCNSFDVHTIKTDKFKTCHMEIVFSTPVKKEEMGSYSFLSDILTESSKKYKTRKDVVIHLEDLYKTIFYGVTTKVGKTLNTSFILDFINPEYIDEESYLQEVMQFPFEMLQKPNAVNEEFDLKTFNTVKERMRREIKGIYENPVKIAFRGAFETLDSKSETAMPIMGSLDELDNITPTSLYSLYKSLYKKNKCNIYIIGNLDMDKVVSLIKENFNNRIINQNKTSYYVENSLRKKVLYKEQDGSFIQATLAMLFNLDDLTKYERDIVFHLYNYILGSGGLTSRLYQSLREENSLCYGVASMYLKYDNLLAIHVSLENENVKKAISLIKKCIKQLAKGDFTEEETEDAKRNLILSLDLSLDNCVAILNNYIFNIVDDLPSIEERKDLISKVTKEEIVSVAKKIKLNTVYVLNGGEQ